MVTKDAGRNSTDNHLTLREVFERGIIKGIHQGNRLERSDFDCRASVSKNSLKKSIFRSWDTAQRVSR